MDAVTTGETCLMMARQYGGKKQVKGRNNKKHAFLNVTFAVYLVLHNLILFQVNAINTVVKTMLEKNYK